MSTTDPARPLSRRLLLSTGTAALATPCGASALAAMPDPALANAEAERAAWEAFDAAVAALGVAEVALAASPWKRKPRVLIGEYTAMVRGPDHEPIPLAEQSAVPIYAHTHAEIDRDCDGDARSPGADPAKVEARRARLRRGLDADAAAIAAAPEVLRLAEASRLEDETGAAWRAAALGMVATVPTTVPGLLAILDRFETHTGGFAIGPDADALDIMLATIRTFVSARA